MNKNLKTESLIVLDLELTCWMGKPPKGQKVEIIEIGIVEIDCVLNKIKKSNSILIKPKSKISKFCTKITSITNEDVINNGISLKDAFSFINSEYETKNKTWCSWGRFDKVQINRECKSHNLKSPFSKKYVNLQKQFSYLQKTKRLYSVENALKEMDIPFLGVPHKAKDDALNTAIIFLKFFN